MGLDIGLLIFFLGMSWMETWQEASVWRCPTKQFWDTWFYKESTGFITLPWSMKRHGKAVPAVAEIGVESREQKCNTEFKDIFLKQIRHFLFAVQFKPLLSMNSA